jgi:hypothetical protein
VRAHLCASGQQALGHGQGGRLPDVVRARLEGQSEDRHGLVGQPFQQDLQAVHEPPTLGLVHAQDSLQQRRLKQVLAGRLQEGAEVFG